MPDLTPAQRMLLAILAMLALFGAGVILGAWLCHKEPVPAGKWTQLKKDGRIADVGTEAIKPKDCAVVVAKPTAKHKMDLPPEIQADPKRHVTTAIVIQPSERPQSVVSLFNEATGTTDMLTQRMAYPWIAIEQRGQLWIGYGLADGGRRAGRIMLREDLLQLSALHLGGMASIDTGGQWFAGIGMAWRW